MSSVFPLIVVELLRSQDKSIKQTSDSFEVFL